MHITIAALAAPEPRRGRLLCPVCSSRHIAPVSLAATSLAGQRGEVRIDADGLHIDPAAPPAEGGSAVVICWRCRHGHQFAVRMRTIYGSTTSETTILPTAANAQDPERN